MQCLSLHYNWFSVLTILRTYFVPILFQFCILILFRYKQTLFSNWHTRWWLYIWFIVNMFFFLISVWKINPVEFRCKKYFEVHYSKSLLDIVAMKINTTRFHWSFSHLYSFNFYDFFWIECLYLSNKCFYMWWVIYDSVGNP